MKIMNIFAFGGVVIIFIFLAFSCQKSTENKQTEPIIAEINIPVQGMMCGSCEYHIETEVKKHDGVVEIKADREKAMTSLDELVAAINETGYKASKPVVSRQ